MHDPTDASAALPDSLRLFSVRQVARILQVTINTVRKLIYEGRLPAVRVGISIRVPLQALDKYLEDNPCRAPDGRRVPGSKPNLR